MRFHILGLAHTKTNHDYTACAYTQKVLKFGKMMTQLGHEVYHYGHKESDLVCTEHIPVIDNDIYNLNYGDHDFHSKFFKFDAHKDVSYIVFNEVACREIDKRKQPGDFLLAFWGAGHRTICDVHKDMIVVEPGIGYASGHFAPYKVFESYALYHAVLGADAAETCGKMSWTDTVIPNYFDNDDFTYSDEKEDYILFLGRVYNGKGIDKAIKATQIAGKKLVVCGQNDENLSFPNHVEFRGHVGREERREVLSKAKALFIGSQYVEPFGGVQVEALLSGTPTITSDIGAFTENNVQGMTGYRCRLFSHYVDAIVNIDKISPQICRSFGEQFLLDPVGRKYEKYFKEILQIESQPYKL